MTDPRRFKPPAWLNTLVLTLAGAALTIAAGFVMFSAFMFYDDEGYVLISLRNFAEHGGLYRDVYTQYGPFPFVVYYGLHLLGLPLTHTAGRLITVAAWSASAGCCALLVGYVTRSLALRLATLAAVFAYLWIMASEPSHPGGFIVLLTIVLATLGYYWISREKIRAWAILAGAVVATLLLTKINIGIFAGFSAVAWAWLHHRHPLVRRSAPFCLSVAGAVLPFALMRPLLGTPWVQTYALVFACAAVALVLATAPTASRPFVDTKTFGWFSAGIAGVMVPVLAVIFARGTTPADLLDGILWGPLRQPTNFSLRYLWPSGMRLVAPASLALCGVAVWLRRRGNISADAIVAALRLIAALALAINIARFPQISPDYLVFGFVMPCIWLFVWPFAGETNVTTASRAWIAWVLLGQCLHVFPVPGSQIAWGSVLALPLAALGGWDAARWLQQRFGGKFDTKGAATGNIATVLVAGFALFVGWRFTQVAERYRDGRNLELPGAEVLRLPEKATALFRVLTLNAVMHSDLVFSLPGMFSFNLWSGLPTPTHANVTHWFSLLSTERQRSIQSELEAHPRACVIIQREHLNFLKTRGLGPSGALYDYIAANFEPAFTLDDFEFCVHRGRKIEPFMLAEAFQRAEGAAGEDSLLKLAVILPAGAEVDRIEIIQPGAGNLVLDAHTARVELAPANLRGEPRGAAEKKTWPLRFEGPAVAWFYYNAKAPRPAADALVVFRDRNGAELGLARVRE